MAYTISLTPAGSLALASFLEFNGNFTPYEIPFDCQAMAGISGTSFLTDPSGVDGGWGNGGEPVPSTTANHDLIVASLVSNNSSVSGISATGYAMETNRITYSTDALLADAYKIQASSGQMECPHFSWTTTALGLGLAVAYKTNDGSSPVFIQKASAVAASFSSGITISANKPRVGSLLVVNVVQYGAGITGSTVVSDSDGNQWLWVQTHEGGGYYQSMYAAMVPNRAKALVGPCFEF